MIKAKETLLRRKIFLVAIFLSFFTYVVLSLFHKDIINVPRSFSSGIIKDDDLSSIKNVKAQILHAEAREYGYRFICNTPYGKAQINCYIKDSTDNSHDEENPFFFWNLVGSEASLTLDNGLSVPEKASNPRLFDRYKYLLSKGITLVATVKPSKVSVTRDYFSHGIEGMYYKLKRRLLMEKEEFIERTFSGESRALAKGILFGDTSEIDEETYRSFQANNSAHILAASGLHVGIIYRCYTWIKRKCGRGFIGSIVPVFFSLFLFMYATVALWSASITRAVLIIYIKMAADKLERRFDLLSSVSLINIIILIYRPYMVFNMGFQMSFLCAYAISVIVPRLKGSLPEALTMPIGIYLFLLPYIMWQFNTISPLGFISNILIIHLVSIYVPLGIFGFTISCIAGGITVFSNTADSFASMGGSILSSLGNFIVWIDETVYSEGRMSFTVPSPPIFLVVLYMSLFMVISSESFMVIRERAGESKIKMLRSMSFLMVAPVIASMIFYTIDETPFDRASQVFIDVGQGDALRLRWDDSLDILIDGGGQYNYDVGNKILKPYLLKNGASDIDIAITTHQHMDHYKGIEELSKEYNIKEIITYGRAGDIIRTGNKERYIELLWPIPKYENSDDENYYSRIFMIHDRGIKTLVTGDITEEGEMALLKEYGGSGRLRCHILKVAHHGSRYSSSTSFLREVKPKVAVISVGKNNGYGHPAGEVIEKLDSLGIIVFRTDVDGAVGIIHRERGFSVVTCKTRRQENIEL